MSLSAVRCLSDAHHYSNWSNLTNLTELKIEVIDNFRLRPGQLPASLKKLEISMEPIGYGWPIVEGILPDSLESFQLYNIDGLLKPIRWPSSDNLTHVDLYINHFSDNLTQHLFPRSLRSLRLHINIPSETRIDELLTPLTALEEFELFCQWEDPNDSLSLKSLSQSLTRLDLSRAEFNRPLLAGDLPASLRSLSLGGTGMRGLSKDYEDIIFHHPLTSESFLSCPDLEILDIKNCTEYPHPIHYIILPKKLRLLCLAPGMAVLGEKSANLRIS